MFSNVQHAYGDMLEFQQTFERKFSLSASLHSEKISSSLPTLKVNYDLHCAAR